MNLNAEFKEMYQKAVNLSSKERVAIGEKYWKDIFDFVDQLDLASDLKGKIFVDIFKYFVSADKNMTTAEYRYFRDITGVDWSEQDFYNYTNCGSDSQFMYDFEKLWSKAPENVRISLVGFALCILTADDTLTVEEQNVFEQFFESTANN